MDLSSATAVVTGGTEGIGRAIAYALGERGARVAICARTASHVAGVVEELRGAGIRAAGTACDVADEAAVNRFAEFVRRELGDADVVVNNAGIGHWASVEDTTTEQFDETFAVNVRGVFLVTRAFLPAMKRRGSGHIVNIASLAGRNPVANAAAYAASKHAVLGFSKSLFMEVRKHNIRVAAICPGTVVTSFFGKSGWDLGDEERKLRPEDVAHAVLAVLTLPHHALISELDLRPTNP